MNLGLYITILMTSGHKLRALDSMNCLGVWIQLATPGCELRALDATNSSECYEKLRVVDDINDSGKLA